MTEKYQLSERALESIDFFSEELLGYSRVWKVWLKDIQVTYRTDCGGVREYDESGGYYVLARTARGAINTFLQFWNELYPGSHPIDNGDFIGRVELISGWGVPRIGEREDD